MTSSLLARYRARRVWRQDTALTHLTAVPATI